MSSIIEKIKNKAVDKLSQVPKPSCELSDLDFKDVSRKNVTMASVVSITNPYDHDLPICTITYKIFSNNREIGSGQLTDPGDIKALDSTKIELPTTIPYDFLWNLMKDIGADWDIDYKFEVGVQFKLPIVGKFTPSSVYIRDNETSYSLRHVLSRRTISRFTLHSCNMLCT